MHCFGPNRPCDRQFLGTVAILYYSKIKHLKKGALASFQCLFCNIYQNNGSIINILSTYCYKSVLIPGFRVNCKSIINQKQQTSIFMVSLKFSRQSFVVPWVWWGQFPGSTSSSHRFRKPQRQDPQFQRLDTYVLQ